MTLSLLLVLAVVVLALSNGANDNFKGVASLFGSRTVGYKVALAWATVTTAAGSLAAIALAEALLKRFSGKGLVPDALATSEPYLVAIVVGAALTVLVASVLGLPDLDDARHHRRDGRQRLDGGRLRGAARARWARPSCCHCCCRPCWRWRWAPAVYAALKGLRRALGLTRAEDSCVCVVETPAAVGARAAARWRCRRRRRRRCG